MLERFLSLILIFNRESSRISKSFHAMATLLIIFDSFELKNVQLYHPLEYNTARDIDVSLHLIEIFGGYGIPRYIIPLLVMIKLKSVNYPDAKLVFCLHHLRPVWKILFLPFLHFQKKTILYISNPCLFCCSGLHAMNKRKILEVKLSRCLSASLHLKYE